MSEIEVRGERVDAEDGSGVYQIRPVLYTRPDGSVAIKPESTFFPDDWSRDQVERAVTQAWRDPLGTRGEDGHWTGVGGGIRIHGWYDRHTGGIMTGYPAL